MKPSSPAKALVHCAVLVNLQNHVSLSTSDRSAVEAFICQSGRRLEPGYELIRAGHSGKGYALLEGWIAREVILPDGRQQVVALFIPGDIFDLGAELIEECEYSLRALTAATVREISRAQVHRLIEQHPNLREALAWEQLLQIAVTGQWVVSLGQRDAVERIAHFFCEIYSRLHSVGLTNGNECNLPLTQAVLAEIVGMTKVHVSRSLRKLRSEGLVEFGNARLRIPDLHRLAQIGQFDPMYLHLAHR